MIKNGNSASGVRIEIHSLSPKGHLQSLEKSLGTQHHLGVLQTQLAQPVQQPAQQQQGSSPGQGSANNSKGS